jgi:tetratricopeptide (TPR) repeat protein
VLLAEAHQFGDRDPQRSLLEAERGLRFAQDAYPGQPTHPRVIYARDVYGRALCHAGDFDRSYAEMTRVLEDARETLGPKSPLVGMTSINRVTCGRRLGYLHATLEDNNRGLEIRGPSKDRDSRAWGNMHASRGVTLLALRRGPEALADLSLATDTLSRALGPTHRMTLSARVHRALALAEVGRADEARDEVRALDALAEAHHESLSFDWVAGRIARLGGRPDEAVVWQRHALEHLPADPTRQWYLMRVLVEMGLAEVDLGLPERAQKSLHDGLALSEAELRQDTPMRADAWLGVGRALAGQQRLEEAAQSLGRADAFWRSFDPENPAGAEAAEWLARVDRKLGRHAEQAEAQARSGRLHDRVRSP